MEERIQKVIAQAGIASRRAAEEMISDGRVTVNGQCVTEPGLKVDPAKDHIKVDGRLIPGQEPFVYLLINKPKGVLSSVSDPEGRPVVTDLIKGVKQRLYPVGRLDMNSEGALLLTNDGALANTLVSPKYRCPKTYLVKVSGRPNHRDLERLERGLTIDGTHYGPCQLRLMHEAKNAWICAVLREGKNHHLRNIFQWIGHPATKIRRIAFAFLTLDNLAPGAFRHLTGGEVARLKRGAFEPKVAVDVLRALSDMGVKVKMPRSGPGPARAKPSTDSGKRPTGRPGTGAPKRPTGRPGTGVPKRPTGRPGTGAPKRPTGRPGTGAPKRPTGRPGTGAPKRPTGRPGTGAPKRPTGTPRTGTPKPSAKNGRPKGPAKPRKAEFERKPKDKKRK